MANDTDNTTTASALTASPGSTFEWIVDRPPTEADADQFGEVVCAKRGSAYMRQNWRECANGFIRPWARTEDAVKAKVYERLKGYPIHFRWSNI